MTGQTDADAKMKIEEKERAAVVFRKDNAPDAEQQANQRRGRVLGITIVAFFVAELSKDLLFSVDHGDWSPVWQIAYYGALACFPFLLARAAPKAAGFDSQWRPSSRWHWARFVGMLFLLLASTVLPAALAALVFGRPPQIQTSFFIEPLTPTGIVLQGIATVFFAPVAEEVFFRGYFLEQLRKLTRSWIALLSHAVVFGLFHLHRWGLFTSLAFFYGLMAFFVALILGA